MGGVGINRNPFREEDGHFLGQHILVAHEAQMSCFKIFYMIFGTFFTA